MFPAKAEKIAPKIKAITIIQCVVSTTVETIKSNILTIITNIDNNLASTHFKVVQTKASNPSFYMSFLSLIGAVGAAVLMSAYYRNKDLEE